MKPMKNVGFMTFAKRESDFELPYYNIKREEAPKKGRRATPRDLLGCRILPRRCRRPPAPRTLEFYHCLALPLSRASLLPALPPCPPILLRLLARVEEIRAYINTFIGTKRSERGGKRGRVWEEDDSTLQLYGSSFVGHTRAFLSLST